MGPAGPGMLTVVDANGVEVGTAIDPFGGTIARKVGDDWVTFQTTSDGLTASPINFFHTTPDCTGPRYFTTTGGVGFAYLAVVRGSWAFYTKVADPTFTHVDSIQSFESIAPDQDPLLPGTCVAWQGGMRSVGEVTATQDAALGALVAPFRIR